jgi:hypothetical protein
MHQWYNADSRPTEYIYGGSAGTSIVIEMGTLKTGFVGPIQCGCVTVLKTQIGVESDNFGERGIFTGIVVGYTDECWF